MRDDRLWPFDIRIAVLWAPILFIGLVLGLALLRQLAQWPPPALDQVVLLAVLLVSLLPVLLAVLDLVAERGGAISFRGVTLDFSAAGAVPTYAVPHNIGLPGMPVTDSGTENIVEALRGAATSEVIVVDLEELFRPVLRMSSVDEDWPAEKKVDAILSTEEPFIAVTQARRYLRLIPRVTGLAAVLRSVTTPRRRAGE